jgi:hypothetical protein
LALKIGCDSAAGRFSV